MMRAAASIAGGVALCVAPATSPAQKVFLNPSDQFENPVAGGGNEAQYAKINADLTAAILLAAGFQVVVDQDFYNAPKNANSWGADVFVSIHSNAGGGHGTVTLYASSGGKVLATHVQGGLVAYLPYQDRGLSHRTDLYVLNKTTMVAALAEVVFHDCAKQTGYQGHPPSESDFLKSAAGQQLIANGLASGVCSYFGWSCGGGVVVPPVQKGWFKGVVYQAPDMADRIPGALVVLNTGASVIASSTGYWEFELEPGTYTATATADGYQPNSSTRTVVAGQEVWGSIGLTPVVVPPEPKPEPIPDTGVEVVTDPGGPPAPETAGEDTSGGPPATETGGEDASGGSDAPDEPDLAEPGSGPSDASTADRADSSGPSGDAGEVPPSGLVLDASPSTTTVSSSGGCRSARSAPVSGLAIAAVLAALAVAGTRVRLTDRMRANGPSPRRWPCPGAARRTRPR